MNIFQRYILPVLTAVSAALNRGLAWLRGTKQTGTEKEGFHVKRDGTIRYNRARRSFFRKLSNLSRSAGMRLGPPKLTGARLARLQKSCCPFNLLVQPFTQRLIQHAEGPPEKQRERRSAECTCGQHSIYEPVFIGFDLAAMEEVCSQ